jgi:hypothetical protein
MQSYCHLVPLVCCYCSVGYLSDSVEYSLLVHRLTGKHLALLTNMVSRFKSFSEAPHLARKCGTCGSDSPVRAL